jgi:hypothetical protein
MPPKVPPPPPPQPNSPHSPPKPKAERRLSAAQLAAKLHTLDQQKELFLFKNQDISRPEVNEMLQVRVFKFPPFSI